MTKAEIVNEVAKATGIEKATVQIVVESFMESVKAPSQKAIRFTFADSAVSSSSAELRKLRETSPRIRQ